MKPVGVRASEGGFWAARRERFRAQENGSRLASRGTLANEGAAASFRCTTINRLINRFMAAGTRGLTDNGPPLGGPGER